MYVDYIVYYAARYYAPKSYFSVEPRGAKYAVKMKNLPDEKNKTNNVSLCRICVYVARASK